MEDVLTLIQMCDAINVAQGYEVEHLDLDTEVGQRAVYVFRGRDAWRLHTGGAPMTVALALYRSGAQTGNWVAVLADNQARRADFYRLTEADFEEMRHAGAHA